MIARIQDESNPGPDFAYFAAYFIICLLKRLISKYNKYLAKKISKQTLHKKTHKFTIIASNSIAIDQLNLTRKRCHNI